VIDVDLPDADYRARPGLSFSGAKLLMRTPKQFIYDTTHPRQPKPEFDRGHAAHRLVLGAGADLALAVDEHGDPFTSWSTGKAKEFARIAREAGRIPLLQKQLDEASAIADAIREHGEAGKLLEAGRFLPEVSVFWTDDETGRAQRARLDALIVEGDDGRPEVVDVKVLKNVTRRGLSTAVHEYRYHWQNWQYCDGIAAHGAGWPRYRMVCAEVDPPHLVRVVELDEPTVEVGGRFMLEARRRYARHLDADDWPGFPERTELIGLPRYAATDPEDEEL
jgi:hypothetical protein